MKRPSVGMLIVVAILLQFLLGLTVLAAHFPLGGMGLVIALSIAGAKAVLVLLFFMHLKFEHPMMTVFAGAGLLWLGILFVLTFSDYLTRPWAGRMEPLPGQPVIFPAPDGLKNPKLGEKIEFEANPGATDTQPAQVEER